MYSIIIILQKEWLKINSISKLQKKGTNMKKLEVAEPTTFTTMYNKQDCQIRPPEFPDSHFFLYIWF